MPYFLDDVVATDPAVELAVTILKAQAAAALATAVVLLEFSWPWRTPGPRRAALGWVFGVGLGFLLGVFVLGLWPKWPPADDRGRLVYVILPMALFVEALASLGAFAWLLRLVVAAAIGPILLYGSVYLTDAAGPGSRVWTPLEMTEILAAFGAAIALQWFALVKLQRKTAGRSVSLMLAFVSAAAGMTVMFSGYADAGQLGLVLAAGLGTAVIASLLISDTPAEGGLGVALVLLAAILLAGRFFGSLTTVHAILLFASPLLAWLPELPYVASLRPWIRGVLRVAIVMVPLSFVVWQSYEKFEENSRSANQTFEYEY